MPDSGNTPIRPRQVGIGFWLLWILSIALFLAGSGCVLVYMSIIAQSASSFVLSLKAFIPALPQLLVMLGGLALLVFALYKAYQKQKTGISTIQLLAYILWLPLLAVFIWSGGCFLGLTRF